MGNMEYRSATVISNEQIAKNIFMLVLQAESGQIVLPGQFVQIKTNAKNCILPRPISVSDYEAVTGLLTLVIQEKGPGTAALCSLQQNCSIEILWPLGNGLEIPQNHKKIWLYGAGLGLAPMLCAARKWAGNVTAFCGYRNADAAFYFDELKSICNNVIITTDDGSYGEKGFLIDAVKTKLQTDTPDLIFACGPTPALAALKTLPENIQEITHVSLEQRMACGYGVCRVCTCQTTREDKFTRICTDGPVFPLAEVVFPC
ncbi:MAG: dihydroorotate dehydrogenase electron transfer subunit [Clostridia bacterium]|nr:dihydroorotate dehydrogenase electron transfer subunit [Clostridia bacterium]